jgi:hypothetical protein
MLMDIASFISALSAGAERFNLMQARPRHNITLQGNGIAFMKPGSVTKPAWFVGFKNWGRGPETARRTSVGPHDARDDQMDPESSSLSPEAMIRSPAAPWSSR